MYIIDDFRFCNAKQIVISFQILPVSGKFGVPEVILFETMSLDHCAHGSVYYKDSSSQVLFQTGHLLRFLKKVEIQYLCTSLHGLI